MERPQSFERWERLNLTLQWPCGVREDVSLHLEDPETCMILNKFKNICCAGIFGSHTRYSLKPSIPHQLLSSITSCTPLEDTHHLTRLHGVALVRMLLPFGSSWIYKIVASQDSGREKHLLWRTALCTSDRIIGMQL